MTTRDHAEFDQDVGAYLLGALPALEAQRFERHLLSCERCQQEAARLRPAVEALGAVEQVEPPGSLKRSLMRTVRHEAARASDHATEERRARWLPSRLRLVPAGVAASLALGIVVGLGIGTVGDDGGGDVRTVAAKVDRVRVADARAALVMPGDESDTAVLRVTNLPPAGKGKVYEVWVSEGGHVRPVSLFEPRTDGSAVAGVEGDLRAADAVLVTRERRGGVANPTEDPVISVRL